MIIISFEFEVNLQKENGTHLDGRWVESKDFVSCSFGVSIHVDQDVDAILEDPVRSFAVAGNLREVNEMLCLSADLLPESGAIIGGQAVAKDLHLASIMDSRQRLHQMAGRVIAKVGGHVANSESAVGGQLFGVLVGGLVQDADLLHAELGMFVGNGLSVLVREGIEHGVMGMDGGQTITFQLISNH